jgi:hypothetical protein
MLRTSPMSLRVNTVEPAPINAILGISGSVRGSRTPGGAAAGASSGT